MEIIRQHLCASRRRNDEHAILNNDQVHRTTANLSSPTKPVTNTIGRSSTTTNNHQSTVDKNIYKWQRIDDNEI